MAGFELRRRDGKFTLKVQGCCGASGMRREYERAFLEQLLDAGGHVTSHTPERVEITDRRGRVHSIDLVLCGLGPDAPDAFAGPELTG